MPVTSNDIANQAIQYIGDNQPSVTGQAPTFDNSTAGQALQRFYSAVVQTVGRQWGWDFARRTVQLSPTGNAAPPPWTYEYNYPPNGIQVWQLFSAAADPNNPVPANYAIANTVVSGTLVKVVHTNLQNAYCTFNNNPSENVWDPLFREAVVRMLASVLAMAIAGKPDTAQAFLESGAAFETLGEGRDD